MWGQVRGQSIGIPIETRFTTTDDVFACFACPSVAWRPITFGMPCLRYYFVILSVLHDNSSRVSVYDAFSLKYKLNARVLLFSVKEHRNAIQDAIRVSFDDPTTADVRISIEGRSIHAHKAILKIRCQYFRSMFRDLWPEGNGR